MNLEDLHDSDEGFEVYDDNKKENVNAKVKTQTYQDTTIARLHKPDVEEDDKWSKYKI